MGVTGLRFKQVREGDLFVHRGVVYRKIAEVLVRGPQGQGHRYNAAMMGWVADGLQGSHDGHGESWLRIHRISGETKVLPYRYT